jgi:hypothetical protein
MCYHRRQSFPGHPQVVGSNTTAVHPGLFLDLIHVPVMYGLLQALLNGSTCQLFLEEYQF